MARLVIVSNRTPAPRERSQPAGGLAVGLQEALTGRDVLWFGWSGAQVAGEADGTPRITQAGRLTYAQIDLGRADYGGYYRGFSNGALWPLLHGMTGRSEFRREDHAAYLRVNAAFAAALAPLLRPDDLVWVHDYHLIPLGRALRDAGVRSRIGFFLHVPFPPAWVYATLPQGESLLRALAACDVIGVQTREDAANLNGAFARLGLEARAETFPIGIDPDGFSADARRAADLPETARLAESLGNRALVLGVDRLDYTKGLPQRFRSFAALLARFPEHRRQVTFLQVAPISRGDVAPYRALRRELDELAGHINGEHAEFDWAPLRYLTRAVPRRTLAGFHRRARVGLVTPLRDGMNLVAKEYVAAQDPDDPGALVLSRFAGAAETMDGALLVNPHDPDEAAEALHDALRMDHAERRDRWARLIEPVRRDTAKAWARAFMRRLEGRP